MLAHYDKMSILINNAEKNIEFEFLRQKQFLLKKLDTLNFRAKNYKVKPLKYNFHDQVLILARTFKTFWIFLPI